MRQIKLSVENKAFCICTFYNNGEADVMIIDSVETKKEFRRQGYGIKLINKALELAKDLKVDSVELVVNEDNMTAKRLYERVGFEKTNKNYYRKII